MNAPDSYDALAASIERALRTDIAPPGSAAHLAGSIDRMMRDEATAGELRLGYLRLVVVVSFVVATGAMLVGAASGSGSSTALISTSAPVSLGIAWLAASAALVMALRRGWYRRWLPHVAPIVDAAMILAGFVLTWRVSAATGASSMALVGYVTALCAFLSLSGALRLSRSAARAGTALALMVFLLAASVMRLDALSAAGIALTLVATGLLGASVTTLIRRVVTDEVARTTLSRMYKEAEETIDAREQVLKIVSHDLRNPLHTISMCASLLLDVPMQPSDQSGHLSRIKRAGERMNRLIQDLLDVAKLEAGRVGIDARELQVDPLVREAHEMLAPLAAEQSIRLDRIVADGLPALTADAGRVLQVLSNLVGNAIKFTPKGGRIVIRAESAPGGVRFSVADTGQGIPPEQLSKLFGQFWQGNPADRRGIGLGLTIAKGIVDAHGGRIWVESRVGEGTTFYFTLATALPPTGSGSHERRRKAAAAGAASG
jgi:signal transduction histidine kinase